MKVKIGKYTRVIAFLMVVFLVIPVFALSKQDIHFPVAEKIELTDDDIKTAGEIANMTGIDIEEIKRLREFNLDWNTIIKRVQKSDIDDDNLLFNENKNYLSMGFTEEEISDVKLVVNRLTYQLEELTSDIEESLIPETEVKVSDVLNDEEEEDFTVYQELLKKIDIDQAIEIILKLSKELSIEESVNEYIYSLQIDLDINLYFENRETYEEQKSQKELIMVGKERITLALIEEKILNKLQQQNKIELENLNSDAILDNDLQSADINNNQPLIEVPTVNSIKPINPKNEIRKEIETINPMNEDGI